MKNEREPNTKLGRFIDNHAGYAILIMISMLLLFAVGLGVGLTNIDHGNMMKIVDILPTLSCDKLIKIPLQYSQWMSYDKGFTNTPTELYIAWQKEMDKC